MTCSDTGDSLTSGISVRFSRKWKTGDEKTSDVVISHETGHILRDFFAFVDGSKDPRPLDNSSEPKDTTTTTNMDRMNPL